jgi:hypothetical protein
MLDPPDGNPPPERPTNFGEFQCQVRAVKDKDRVLRFVGTTEIRDRMGDEITLKGWDFSSFKKNPVFLWGHEYWNPPIGRIAKISKQKVGDTDAWVFDAEFMPPEVNPEAEKFLKITKWLGFGAVSVGFRPTKSEPIAESDEEREERIKKEPDNYPGVRFLNKELLELSLVTVPANPEAILYEKLIDARRKGYELPEPMAREVAEYQKRKAHEISSEAINKTRELKKRLEASDNAIIANCTESYIATSSDGNVDNIPDQEAWDQLSDESFQKTMDAADTELSDEDAQKIMDAVREFMPKEVDDAVSVEEGQDEEQQRSIENESEVESPAEESETVEIAMLDGRAFLSLLEENREFFTSLIKEAVSEVRGAEESEVPAEPERPEQTGESAEPTSAAEGPQQFSQKIKPEVSIQQQPVVEDEFFIELYDD